MILAINTSTLQFGLAILEEDGTVLAEYFMSERDGHFGNLMPALFFLFSSLKSDIHDVKGIAVAMGPGSFTGLRVGLSTAKGLCHALNVPIIGISSLEALASQLSCADLPVSSILNSKKGEVFAAQFVWNEGYELIRDMEDTCVKIEDLLSLFDKPTIIIGNDYVNQGTLLKNMPGSRVLLAPAYQWNLKPSSVGFLGLRRFLAHDFDDLQGLNPLYHRPPNIRPNPSFPHNPEIR